MVQIFCFCQFDKMHVLTIYAFDTFTALFLAASDSHAFHRAANIYFRYVRRLTAKSIKSIKFLLANSNRWDKNTKRCRCHFCQSKSLVKFTHNSHFQCDKFGSLRIWSHKNEPDETKEFEIYFNATGYTAESFPIDLLCWKIGYTFLLWGSSTWQIYEQWECIITDICTSRRCTLFVPPIEKY